MEAAFFDLDKTVIAKASMVAFSRPLYRAGMISPWLVARAMWGQMIFHLYGADEESMRKVRESALRITRGWEQARIATIVRETLTDVIEPIVYQEALDLIHEHQAAGRRVFIVSASPEEIVTPLAQYLGVDEAISTRACLDDEGRYTGEVEFYAYGPHKADAIREASAQQDIDLDASFAYSDSITDLPMLECVGRPVVVNPDRELLRAARARDWEVRWFEHGVPLRERVSLPEPGTVAAVSGIVMASGAVLALAWWMLRQRDEPLPPTRGERTLRRVRVFQQWVPGIPSAPQTPRRGPGLRRSSPAASSPPQRRARRSRPGRAASSWRRA
jgi:HAD superfamily hydrolase (TIGR01490 family)